MKKSKIIAAISGLGLAAVATFIIAADHIDSPQAAAQASHDIADLYAFEGEDPDNTVFVATLSEAQGAADFDENVLVEFNIDTTGDGVEDFVIQALPRDGVMYFNGPVATSSANTGTSTTIAADATFGASVNIDGAPATNNGISYFAGKRNDAFFFDFSQFNAVKGGTSTAQGGGFFTDPADATDLFVGLNVNAVIVEVPNALLGEGAPHGAGTGVNVYNVWVETKRKQ